MVWIVSANIAGDASERQGRLQFIKEITEDRNSKWVKKSLPFIRGEFYECETADGLNGAFITAHNYTVYDICMTPRIANKDFVVANTCIMTKNYDKAILKQMLKWNSDALLFFAKQAQIWEGLRLLYSNSINNVGTFGFKTSKSERILYRNRRKGLMEAIKCAFDLVVLEGANG